jgi:transposase
VSIVMGLDQHRGQITGEWIDTDTGEVQRTRVSPADRGNVRKWLERFRGQQLEVALEATTGWRFVVEELRLIGAVVHLAEPAETAGLRGPKKRAKGDRADARHLRELLMVGRLPESWIPPDHILDLRARVRLRHTLSEQRSEWQQRIQATLYHHGCPQRRQLMVGDGREWLAAQPLPETAREQVTVALAMIDGIEAQIAPIDKELRSYARRQAGCKALMGHYGIGPLVAVTILAELGDCTRFSSSRLAVRYAGMDITVHQSDQRRAPGHLSRQGPPALRWAVRSRPVPPAAQLTRPRLLPPGGGAARRQPSSQKHMERARRQIRMSRHSAGAIGRDHSGRPRSREPKPISRCGLQALRPG